ncbi:hypothetical protein HK105_202216 [Polyrhizophydium stewartii]|uniref:Protein kinase domain-containing protein n=1 Tax=Polyrhizophydium stewartii TaxID=2732419 RepID=A0ABR4NFR0_9FUNG
MTGIANVDEHAQGAPPSLAARQPEKKRSAVTRLFGCAAPGDPDSDPDDKPALAPVSGAPGSRPTMPAAEPPLRFDAEHAAELASICETALLAARHDPAGIDQAISALIDGCYNLRGRILDARCAGEATKTPQAGADPGSEAHVDPALEQAFQAAKSALSSAAESKAGIAFMLDILAKQVDPSVSVPGANEIGDVLGAATSLVGFVQLLVKPSDAGAQGVKAATRFLATNSLEIASTVVNIAKVAADFVPIPGLATAIGIIDKILANIGDSQNAPKIMQALCSDLADIKAIIAPMANQWFSADVRRKCSDLVALLKEADAAVEKSKADSKTWRALVGGAGAKMTAQVEALRKKLATNKDLLSLAMQVDSAMMLMRMAKQLNIIDLKADKMLAILRPRTLLLHHDDFMIAPTPIDASGTFRVFKAKMDGSEYVVKEFRESIDGREEAIEAEARRWFNANHPSLLQLTGVCLDRDRHTGRGPFVALPFVEHDLESFLAENPDLDMDDRISIMLRIARGLKYLHKYAPSAPVVHGNLTLRHVRIEARFDTSEGERVLKVNKIKIVPAIGVAGGPGSRGDYEAFMAPELSQGQPATRPSADIFSFAALCMAVITGCKPANVWKQPLARPRNLDKELWSLMFRCKEVSPRVRPKINRVVSVLSNASPSVQRKYSTTSHSEVERLCAVFPDWTEDNEILATDSDPRGDQSFVFDLSTKRSLPVWRLDWSESHSLTALRLTGCGLTGPIPAAINSLPHLRELWLDQNEFEGEVPWQICSLTKLQSLRLRRNKLTGSLPIAIWKLADLEELDVADNRLDAIPETLVKLAKLRIINVARNLISRLPEQIGRLENLEVLVASDRFEIGRIEHIPESIGDLKKLNLLDLSKNRIRDLPESLGNLENLCILNLACNQIEQLPDSLSRLWLLEQFRLNNNRLSTLPEWIGKMSSLTWLTIAKCNVESLPDALCNLTELRKLNLASNQIRELPQAMGNLTKLTIMKIDGNQIQELPESIGNLKNLEKLCVGRFAQCANIERFADEYNHSNAARNMIARLPGSIGALESIRELSLDKNKLPEKHPVVEKLAEMTRVHLPDGASPAAAADDGDDGNE